MHVEKSERMTAAQLVTAYHEAGHAFVAFMLNIKIKGASIVGGDGFHGSVKHSGRISGDPSGGFFTDKMYCNAQRQVMVALAGLESQRRFQPSSVRNYHASSDHRGAIDLLFHFARSTEEVNLWLRLLSYRTSALVEQCWPGIESLAALLMEKQSLSGKETEEAIRQIMFEKKIILRAW